MRLGQLPGAPLSGPKIPASEGAAFAAPGAAPEGTVPPVGPAPGPETAAAWANFGRAPTPARVIRAYARVKQAALRAWQEASAPWPPEVFAVLDQVWADLAEGARPDCFQLPLFQGGAGTSLHFSLLETAAAEARRRLTEAGLEYPLDPLADLNRGQSTNDTLPTALTVQQLEDLARIEGAVIALQEALVAREQADRNVLTVGRTEGQDALPLRWGQIWASYAGLIERDRWRLARLRERVRSIPLGGTAVGTGLGASRAYTFAAERHLRELTGLPLARSQNPCDEVAHHDKWAEWAGTAAAGAGSLFKLARDLLEACSGPEALMRHPRLQAGSTQMPDKANPVLLELACGLALEAQGEAAKVQRYAQEGRAQLNSYTPFLWQALLALNEAYFGALQALTTVLPRLELDTKLCAAQLRRSPALLNALAVRHGYARVRAWAEALSPEDRQSWEALAEGLARVSGRSAEAWRADLDPAALTALGGLL